MPNRIIREGILDSDRVDRLSAAAEVFYRRLQSVVDDFGRFDGRLSTIASACFPLRVLDGRVKARDVDRWLDECAAARLVTRYVVGDKPFVQVEDFRQQQRAKQSRYPAPPPDAPTRSACLADAAQKPSKGIAHAHLGVGVVVVGDEDVSGDEGEYARARASHPPTLPKTLTPQTWSDWKAHLANRGKAMTPQAEAVQLHRLADHADPERVVQDCLANGWLNLPPVGGHDSQKPRPKSRHEQRAETAAAIHGATPNGKPADPIDITAESRRVG